MKVLGHFVERLPGVLGVKDGHGFSLGQTASLPTCDLRRLGEERYVPGGAGVADRRVVCRKTAADAHGWEDVLAVSPVQSATIASGAVTLSGPWVRLLTADTQAAAASDDLDTISGGTAGQVVTVRAADDARTVVVTGAGNLDVSATDGSATLNNAGDTITLIHNGTNWLETGRSNNGA